jgi:ribosomal protein L32
MISSSRITRVGPEKNQEWKTSTVKFYAAGVGPAIGAIAKLLAILGRVSGQNGLVAAGCVLLVLAVVVGALWYIRRMSNGEDAPPPTAFQVPPQTDTTESRPVSRVKADNGYFKKCATCGKFTRDAKVCRNCGRDLTDRVHRR